MFGSFPQKVIDPNEKRTIKGGASTMFNKGGLLAEAPNVTRGNVMDPLLEHHFYNIANGKAVQNEDGSLSTVGNDQREINGVQTLIPSIWDGKQVDRQTAIDNAINSGVNWQKAYGDNAVETLQKIEQEIKTFEDESGRLYV